MLGTLHLSFVPSALHAGSVAVERVMSLTERSRTCF